MTDLELLSRRLAQTERRVRWMTRGAILAGIAIMAVAGIAQVQDKVLPGDVLPNGTIRLPQAKSAKPSVEAEVRANHFVLVDEKGKDRASLVADNAGSVFLVMFDAAGKTRANLSVSNDGPSLVLYDATGRQRTIIGSTTLVGSHVNDNGVAEKGPASSIVLFDRAGKLLWRQP
jgi:hypothetical protein